MPSWYINSTHFKNSRWRWGLDPSVTGPQIPLLLGLARAHTHFVEIDFVGLNSLAIFLSISDWSMSTGVFVGRWYCRIDFGCFTSLMRIETHNSSCSEISHLHANPSSIISEVGEISLNLVNIITYYLYWIVFCGSIEHSGLSIRISLLLVLFPWLCLHYLRFSVRIRPQVFSCDPN